MPYPARSNRAKIDMPSGDRSIEVRKCNTCGELAHLTIPCPVDWEPGSVKYADDDPDKCRIVELCASCGNIEISILESSGNGTPEYAAGSNAWSII